MGAFDNLPEHIGSKTPSKVVRARHQARMRAVQALYQWQLNPCGAQALVREFFQKYPDMRKVDADYFAFLVQGVIEGFEMLDDKIASLIKLPITRLDPVEWQVLRLACWELLKKSDVPKRVIINEAIELAKLYGSADGHKFVNGVVDKLSQQLRAQEQ